MSAPGRAVAWVRRAVAAPITPGAKRATATLFVLVLALFAGNLLFTAHEVNAVRAAQAASARATVHTTQLCQAVNAINGKQPVLWGHIVAISQPPPHETAAQRRRRLAVTRGFIAYLGRLFAPIHCSAPLTTRSTP